MTSNASGTIFVSEPGEFLADAGGDPGAHPLLSRPGLALPLLLIVMALSAILLASAILWQLGSKALDNRAEDMDWVFAQTQVEALRLHEAAENYAEDPSAAPEFRRRHATLVRRLAQVGSGPPGQLAERLGLDDEIAAARRAVLAHDPGAGRPDRQRLATLTAQLARLEQALAMAGSRANSAYNAMKSGRVESLHRTILLGLPLLLAGLLGAALLALRMLRIERRVLEGRRLERDLQRERDDASYMRNISAVISHQMRAPLAVIDSTAQRMLRRPDVADQAEIGAAMLRIRRQVRRVLHFMDQAMLAGTVEAGHPELALQPVAVDELIGMVMDSEAIRDQRDRLVPPPAPAAGLRALCDRELAFHALSNIVENALKYSPERSPVELHVTERDGVAVISVTDHGRGIPAAEQAAIFRRFWRGSNSGDRPGTGIGLWLARRLMEVQGGTIRVDSDGQSGARFDLCLPADTDGGSAGPWPRSRRNAEAQHQQDGAAHDSR